MTDIVIVNAGNAGREAFSWIRDCIRGGQPWRIKGFLDDRPSIMDGMGYPVPVLGAVDSYSPASDEAFVCAMGDPRMKAKYSSMLTRRGARFVNVVHPTAVVGEHVRLGHGMILAPFSSLGCDLTLGNFVTISSFSGAAHDTVIGDYCQISGHCGINGNAVLETGVFLGSHAVILPRAVVGAWAYVGAGSVVLRRVAPSTKVFGSPAVVIARMEPVPGYESSRES